MHRLSLLDLSVLASIHVLLSQHCQIVRVQHGPPTLVLCPRFQEEEIVARSALDAFAISHPARHFPRFYLLSDLHLRLDEQGEG